MLTVSDVIEPRGRPLNRMSLSGPKVKPWVIEPGVHAGQSVAPLGQLPPVVHVGKFVAPLVQLPPVVHSGGFVAPLRQMSSISTVHRGKFVAPFAQKSPAEIVTTVLSLALPPDPIQVMP